MAKTVYDRINEELKKRKITKKEVAHKLGYADTSGFTNAVKRGTLRLNDFMEIAFMLEMRPMDLFPHEIKANIYNMSLYDLIENIVLSTLNKHIEKEHKKHNEVDEKFNKLLEKNFGRGGAR